MPYEVSFRKAVKVTDAAIYINECCWGGDIVRDELLPLISDKYEGVWTNQEDWGWFIWFRRGPIQLGVNIFCDDPRTGEFRLWLSSHRKKLLVFRSDADFPELEEVRRLVCTKIEEWAGAVKVEAV